jgi:predicted nucleic acid-binding protein
LIYVDSSAFLKLVLTEAETRALERFVEHDHPGMDLVSSTLLVVESRRTVQRVNPAAMPWMDVRLTRVGMVEMGAAVVESASRLPDPLLRSLDAIHLATAMMIADSLTVFVTYDKRLSAAASALGLQVSAPA